MQTGGRAAGDLAVYTKPSAILMQMTPSNIFKNTYKAKKTRRATLFVAVVEKKKIASGRGGVLVKKRREKASGLGK